ncbi:MAG: undecaprenyldiphospho-muramoylpentapeptide beta-N-acetylglucosaminyltransferase [Planctomycetaceae bacterium]
MPRTVVFAGGGTGGHLFPGVAVAEELQLRDSEMKIVFAGSGRPIEQTIFDNGNWQYFTLNAASSAMLRHHPVKFLWRYFSARRQAKKWLRECRPDAVVGLGGYASVPVVLAAASLEIPVALLEQNIVAGRATRWLSGRADVVCHAFEDAISTTPNARSCVVTGNPVRSEILESIRGEEQSGESVEDERPTRDQTKTLLILGGSQGASAVNAMVLAALSQLDGMKKSWRVVHQTGPGDVEKAKSVYSSLGIEHRVAAFFTEMPQLYLQADLLISRAGATTLAEVSCAGIPALLVPAPFSLRDHQLKNARYYERHGAAKVVLQGSDSQSTVTTLSSELKRLMSAPSSRKEMRQAMKQLARLRATFDVANLIRELCGENPQTEKLRKIGSEMESPRFLNDTRLTRERLTKERPQT